MILGYITCKDKKEAQALAVALLKDKLIACANIHESVQSFYHNSQNALEQSNESVLMIKTLQKHSKAVIERVKKLHSYHCPCVVFYKIIEGNSDYLSWLQKQVT